MEELSKWLNTDNRTDPELAYLIPNYILIRGNKPFSTMESMFPMIKALAESQDITGRHNFTKVYEYLYTVLLSTELSSGNVKQLSQQPGSDQAVYH